VPPLCAGGSSIAGNIGQQKLNSDYASQVEFGSYLAELSDFRKTLDAAVGEKLPSTIKNDLGIYLLHYNDVVAAVNEPELAKQFKEKFGISQELAQTVAAVAAGIAGNNGVCEHGRVASKNLRGCNANRNGRKYRWLSGFRRWPTYL
jgi:hypothetical protein